MKKGLIITLGVIGGLLILAYALLIGPRNKFVSGEENIKQSWSQVENVMQRRADLIPNLVATVKGYAKQEKEIFTAVADARARMAGAQTPAQKVEANRGIDSALARLLVVVEKYPDLKSNANFQALQDELSGTENRISVERMRYNDAIKNYNLMVRTFPNNIAASLFGFQPKEDYFAATEGAKAVPQVNF